MAQGRTRRTRILLVDHEQSIRLTLPRALARYGFDVTSVANVHDALTEIQAEQFDVLLCGLNFPAGNAGTSVLGAMREMHPSCINFILIDDPAVPNLEHKDRYAISHCFGRPVDVDGMVSILQRKLADAAAVLLGPTLRYSWQQSVLTAFTEGRTEHLPHKISVAERAITVRLRDSTPAELDERIALQGALRSLGLLFPQQSAARRASHKREETA